MKPSDPVTALHRVGPAAARSLARLGISSVGDLLLHMPMRYEDRTRFVPLREVEIGQSCLVAGELVKSNFAYGRRRSLTATISDGAGFLTMRLFHFSRRQLEALRPGVWLRCFGEVRAGPAGREMVHPEYRVTPTRPDAPEPALTPVYPATDGFASARIRACVEQVLDADVALNGSVLPGERIPSLDAAVLFLHRPPADATAEALGLARERVARDELLAHHLLMRERQKLRARHSTTPLPRAQGLGRELLRNLGFRLTGAQRRVVSEVLNDLDSPAPMMRLLQGDVGSGKTVVAAFAAIRAAEHGCQTAIMAPTEILAEQHYETLSGWLSPLGIEVSLVTGRLAAGERRARLAQIACGEALVVAGTHALFQGSVEFASLALTIIDEQHRFGVHQRMQLRQKGDLPHQLVMTATPIPRTLTMALYADMDVSVIDELPPGRPPVHTSVVSSSRRTEVVDRLISACRTGRQAYWICTLIEASDSLDSQAAENVAKTLRDAASGLRIGLVHGRLSATERAQAMAGFKNGDVDVLVATTVVEVGVDVPNASLMVIDNPERLGLAQLHQLRGRIGRGRRQSDCILLFDPPISDIARSRLGVMRETSDGFVIAEKDLELRGPGDILGTRQTGLQTFKVADLVRDAALIPSVVEMGARLEAPVRRTIIDTWSPFFDDSYVEV